MPTLPNVVLKGQAYENVYALTGISVGTALTIQNKTSGMIFLQNLGSVPSSNSNDGFCLGPHELIYVHGDIVGLWAKGSGPIAVEVYTA